MIYNNTDYKVGDDRVFKISTVPRRRHGFNIKRQVTETDPQGNPVKRGDGTLIKKEVDAVGISRIPGTFETFTPARNPENGKLVTGLDVLVANPWKNEKDFISEKWEKELSGKDKITLQRALEYEHKTEIDFYTNDIPMGLPSKGPRKFFESDAAKIQLSNNMTYLRMNNAREKVLYYVLNARVNGIKPYVALSWDDYVNGHGSECDYYFIDDEEKAALELTSIEKDVFVGKSIGKLEDAKDGLIHMANALELEETNDERFNEDKAKSALYKFIKENNTKFEIFKEHFELWSDKAGKAVIKAYAEINEMLQRGVIERRNSKFFVNVRDGQGSVTESKMFQSKDAFAKEFLLDPAFSESVKLLRQELESRRK